jgi:hypothetical protein
MDVALYTGNNTARSITGLGFSPDFVWIKGRSGATDHALYDTMRGVEKDLVSNSTAAETTQTTGLTAFNSDGFSIGTLAKLNTNAATYAAWAWDAGSSTVTNTSGSISSQVRANASAGFSVVTYTGSGTTIRVFEGVTELDFDGIGTAAGKWTATRSVTSGTLSGPGAIRWRSIAQCMSGVSAMPLRGSSSPASAKGWMCAASTIASPVGNKMRTPVAAQR